MILYLLIALLNFVAVAINVKAMTLQHKNTGKVDSFTIGVAIVSFLVGLYMLIAYVHHA